jgi:CHAT domain-containing protein
MYQDCRYLIQDHPICYNHSAAAFVKSKNQQHRRSNHQIATWAPHFDSMLEIIKEKGLGESLAPLPAAEKEAILIAELFGNQARIGQEATEAKFKQLANQYSVLHIATHGVLDDVNPLASSLILSNEGIEDGVLMASELYTMQLNANMAVLSACNSGMGKLSKAEGVVGVASGFAYAGVPNIVMSKWPVSDWSTSVLMKSFYEKLKTGMPKDEALQLAKIEYLSANKGKERLLAPFFWGGFVLHGNTEPIDTLSPLRYSYGWIIGGLLLLIIPFLFLRRQKQLQRNNAQT